MSLISPYVMFPGGGGGGFGVTFITTQIVNIAANSHTFSGVSLGAADTNRVIYVAMPYEYDNGGASTLTMTIGGVSASLVVKATEVSSSRCEIWKAAVPNGTTGDVVITATAAETFHQVQINIYRVISGTEGATANDNNTGQNQLNINLNTLSGGVVIACAGMEGQDTTATWNGVTEQSDASTNSFTGTSGFVTGLSAETPRTVNVTFAEGGGTDRTSAVAVAIS